MTPQKAVSRDDGRVRDDGLSAHPVIKSFLSGAFSGFCSTVVFQPFDLVKTRLQEPTTIKGIDSKRRLGLSDLTQHEIEHSSSSSSSSSTVVRDGREKRLKRPSMTSVVVQVVRDDGFFGLWRGVTPSLARTVPGVGLYFGFLHSLKTAFHLHQRKMTSKESFLIGATSRVSAAGVLMPFTVIKARFESGLFNYRSVVHALFQISRTEGIKGLWSGMVATIIRDAPYSGLYLMFYTRAKDYASTAKHQLVKRSNISSSSIYSSSSSSSSSTNSSILLNLIDSTPTSTVYFLCSVSAGVLASAATQPPDVVKTRMQLHPGKHRHFLAAVAAVWKSEGAAGFFAGFVPRTMRRTLMAAATWTLYEQMMSWMGIT